jgi:hypothetical protein
MMTVASTRARLCQQLHLPVDEHIENALAAMTEKIKNTANDGRRALFTEPQWNDGNLADINKYCLSAFDNMSYLHLLFQLALFDLCNRAVHARVFQRSAGRKPHRNANLFYQ